MKLASASGDQFRAGAGRSGFAGASLAGIVNFRSHLHSGHRVATEYTIRPKATHLVLIQALILHLLRAHDSSGYDDTLPLRSEFFALVFDYGELIFLLAIMNRTIGSPRRF